MTPSVKVIHVIDSLRIGGAERVLVDLCNILKLNNFDVSVMVLTSRDSMRKSLHDAIPYFSVDRKIKWSLFKLYKVNSICNMHDIVHVHLRYNFRYLALAKFIFRGRYKLLLHDHFGDIENDKQIPFGIRFFLRRKCWFIGVSKPLVSWAIKNVGLKDSYCFLLPNIILKTSGVRTASSILSPLKILHVSNFRASKNHNFAIELLAQLRSKLSFEVTFVGQIINEDYFKVILKKIEENNLNDILHIKNDCDDVQSILGDFHLAVHTAHQESGPLVLIEYLAQNLPFVSFKTGEVATQVHDIIPDFFMNNFVISDWMERIRFVLENKTKYDNLISNCFERLYSSNVFLKQILSIYTSIISSSDE